MSFGLLLTMDHLTKRVFILFDVNGKNLGRRAVNVPEPQKAYRLRDRYVVIGTRGLCHDCGHGHNAWTYKDPRHEYDHFLGYSCINKILVQEVCRPCHVKRTMNRKREARQLSMDPAA